jgi:two-component system, chemotaxis family, CheB/CheR fusion protein
MNESNVRIEPLAVIAQELRTPIGAIRNAVSLMESAGRLPSGMDQAKRLIAKQVGQLSVLVDGLLDLASITRGMLSLQPGWTDVVREVEAAVEASAWVLTESGHALIVELPPLPIPAFLDGTRVRQIVTHLLDNACKHTPPFGRIRISLQRLHGFAVLLVEDSGVGIARERLPFAFDLFTLSDDRDAAQMHELGVGLALVRELTHLHGGDVQASSKGIGGGSVFMVRLPI